MLAHWLAHYAANGVRHATHTHVVLHPASAASEAAARSLLAVWRVSDVSVERELNVSELEGKKVARVSAFIQTLPPDAWLAGVHTVWTGRHG